MTITSAELTTWLQDAAALIQSPAVTAIGAATGPEGAAIVTLIQGLAGVSSSIATTGTTAVAAIESGDLAKIQAADATIQAANTALAAAVAAS
jgi:hypothetical protein